MKYSPWAGVLSVWSPAGGTILGGSGNFRMWKLAGESRSLGKEEGLSVTCP
jgi:hypothetical protein